MKSAAFALVVLLVIGGGCGLLIKRFDDSLCANEIKQTVVSPDGKLKAVVFDRGCGATTGSSTQISVLGAGAFLPNDGGNLFIADAARNKSVPVNAWGGPRVRVQWSGPRTVRVAYPKPARVFLQNAKTDVSTGFFHNETVTAAFEAETGPVKK